MSVSSIVWKIFECGEKKTATCRRSAGDVQVAAQTDREEEARQNQRVHRAAQGSAAGTSQADGEAFF